MYVSHMCGKLRIRKMDATMSESNDESGEEIQKYVSNLSFILGVISWWPVVQMYFSGLNRVLGNKN